MSFLCDAENTFYRKTAYKKINKLKPGHYLHFKENKISIKKYWDIDPGNKNNLDFNQASEELRYRIKKAVNAQTISDVPLGFLLSGGLDSSTVTAYADILTEDIKTFSMGFEPIEHSELKYAKILAETLKNNGFKIYSGGTDTHLMLVDLRPFNVKGNITAESLSRANITCNKNGIPFDTESPMITSGIRLGSQAATTRGFGLNEFKKVGELITKTVKGVASNPEDNSKIENEVRKEVVDLCSKFPIYKNLR